MTTATLSRALVLAALVLLPAGAAGAADAPDNPADRAAIEQLIARTTEAFNRHDAKAFASYYTSDAWLVTVRGESMAGTAEIEKGLASIFQSRAQVVKLETIDVSIRFLTPETALAHVLNELSGLKSPGGEALPPHRELSLRVLVKKDGVWRVAAFHNTMVRPFGADPPPATK